MKNYLPTKFEASMAVVVPKGVTTLHRCTLVKVDDRVIPLGPFTCICPYSWSESISVELTFSHILFT